MEPKEQERQDEPKKEVSNFKVAFSVILSILYIAVGTNFYTTGSIRIGTILFVLGATGFLFLIIYLLSRTKMARASSFAEKVSHVFPLWIDIATSLMAIAISALFIRYYVVQPFYVEGHSMETSFHDGEYILVNEFSYHFSNPKRGDVVVFKFREAEESNYIKRIIGLPGEKIEVKKGKIKVYNNENPSGLELSENYIKAENGRTEGNKEWTLGENEYFVLGDNRLPNASSDSRIWGPIGKEDIIGRAWVVIWPMENWHGIAIPSYGI